MYINFGRFFMTYRLNPCTFKRYITVLPGTEKDNMLEMIETLISTELIEKRVGLILVVLHLQLPKTLTLLPLLDEPHPGVDYPTLGSQISQVRGTQTQKQEQFGPVFHKKLTFECTPDYHPS